MYWRLLCAFVLIGTCLGSLITPVERNITSYLNPGCPATYCNGDNNLIINVIHVRADGPNDSIHYLWDLTNKPTAIVARTDLNTSLTIDWEALLKSLPNSVSFSSEASYSFAVVINKIWEFDDKYNTGKIDGVDDSLITSIDTENLKWVRQNYTSTSNRVDLVLLSANDTSLLGNGSIRINLSVFGDREHGDKIPHLFHSENSTQFDIEFMNLKMNSNYNSPRIGFEVILVGSEKREENGNFTVRIEKRLDDEHTPGIFEVTNILSPLSESSGNGGFIQYRPVAYTHAERDVSTSTETHQNSPVPFGNLTNLNETLVWAYYGNRSNTILLQAMNVSFGLTGDGFFTKTNFCTWTFVMGYGAPPPDELSTFVFIVAAIGLGMPILLLVCGCGYMCVRRCRNRSFEQLR